MRINDDDDDDLYRLQTIYIAVREGERESVKEIFDNEKRNKITHVSVEFL